jgi:4-aminobutyrate aminotransferase-like enzyme
VIAFEGAYHGLGYGALNATHRDFFRSPFRQQLGQFGHFVLFPTTAARLEEAGVAIRRCFNETPVGAILVEPIQGRGGIRVPPPDFLPFLRRVCNEHGALLIVDEIYTALGRTGRWFACEHSRTVPDLICLGKALTGGFPLSACVGRAGLMDAAWPKSAGEALHTSTFLGHPVGCAMALAQIHELRRRRLIAASARLGKFLLACLSQLHPPKTLMLSRRGCGLMVGLELRQLDGSPATDAARRVVKLMLQRGFILLTEGQHGNVLAFTPPLIITERQLARAVDALQTALLEGAG